jgi:hypothetical protein
MEHTKWARIRLQEEREGTEERGFAVARRHGQRDGALVRASGAILVSAALAVLATG